MNGVNRTKERSVTYFINKDDCQKYMPSGIYAGYKFRSTLTLSFYELDKRLGQQSLKTELTVLCASTGVLQPRLPPCVEPASCQLIGHQSGIAVLAAYPSVDTINVR